MLAFRLRSVSRKSSSPPEFTLQGVVAEIGVEVNYPETHKVSKQESGIIGNVSVNVVVPTTNNISITQQAIIGEVTLVEPAQDEDTIESLNVSSSFESVGYEDMRYEFNVTVKDSVTGIPLENVLLTMNPGGRTEITDTDGKATFIHVVGYQDFTITPTHDSYPEQTIVWSYNLQGQLGEPNKVINTEIFLDIPAEIDTTLETTQVGGEVAGILFDNFVYDVTFTVYDTATNEKVSNAYVSHGEQTVKTNQQGVAVLYNIPGLTEQTVVLSHPAYNEVVVVTLEKTDGSSGRMFYIDIPTVFRAELKYVETSDVSASFESISWENMQYELNITVRDSQSDALLEGVLLTMSTGQVETTDINGEATFANIVGYQDFTIIPTHASYPEQTIVWSYNLQGQLGEPNKTISTGIYMDIPGDISSQAEEIGDPQGSLESITWEETYVLYFKVIDHTEANIEGAQVTVTNLSSKLTDSNGETNFARISEAEYEFSVSKSGIPTQTGLVVLDSNKLVTVTMQEGGGSIVITVVN